MVFLLKVCNAADSVPALAKNRPDANLYASRTLCGAIDACQEESRNSCRSSLSGHQKFHPIRPSTAEISGIFDFSLRILSPNAVNDNATLLGARSGGAAVYSRGKQYEQKGTLGGAKPLNLLLVGERLRLSVPGSVLMRPVRAGVPVRHQRSRAKSEFLVVSRRDADRRPSTPGSG
jgi:hypothetical protein